MSYTDIPGLDPPNIVPGVPLATTEITVRLATSALERMTNDCVPVSAVWLSPQPDGTYALGMMAERPLSELGLQAREVENDDRDTRFSI